MKKTIADIDVRGRRILLRVDFNVPLDPNSGDVVDDTRIRAALPTIEYLRERETRLILCSHLGRPKGIDDSLRMAPVARRLSELLRSPVKTTDDCVGPQVEAAVKALGPGEVLLLENLRFHPEEEANDPDFARALASLAGLYVNDAFGTAHRAHASTAGVAAYLPAVAGFLMEKELTFLGKALVSPDRPFAAVIGGAKISTKMGVLENLLEKVDRLIIGGGMASNFLKSEGLEVGQSLVEEDYVKTARQIMERASQRGLALLLPSDVVVGDRFAADAGRRQVSVKEIPVDWQILDIGEKTTEAFVDALRDCRTVLWNGPMGVIEFEPFSQGSHRLAEVIAGLEATTIVGGGETVAVVERLGLEGKFSHVSTGGGAALEFLEGRELPGVAALQDKD
ncbi:MAG: phosphoglycerate kinase [Dehalococcoidia bacterium SM23_28_2]|nr:MAG: phosphoglycerate kinase [Dehalococcoidia bacterium SM23_28_2]